jgi:PIN domain nuclease of toxin-antitoxin system
MEFILDSHTLIWAMDDPAKLSLTVASHLRDPDVILHLSPATYWEMAIKVALGMLPLSLPYRRWMDTSIVVLDLRILPISLDHTERMTSLPFHHKDPFDRMLAAQSLANGVPLLSADVVFDAYGVNRVW